MWILLQGLAVLGLKEVFYWSLKFLAFVSGKSWAIDTNLWALYGLSLLTVWFYREVVFAPIERRDSESDYARQKALMAIQLALGDREFLNLLNHGPTDSKGQPLLSDAERRQVVKDAGYLVYRETGNLARD